MHNIPVSILTAMGINVLWKDVIAESHRKLVKSYLSNNLLSLIVVLSNEWWD